MARKLSHSKGLFVQFYAKENPLLSVTIHNHNHPLNYGPVTFPHTSSLHGGNSEESGTVLTHYFIFIPFSKEKKSLWVKFLQVLQCWSFDDCRYVYVHVGHDKTVCMSKFVMSWQYVSPCLSCYDCMCVHIGHVITVCESMFIM